MSAAKALNFGTGAPATDFNYRDIQLRTKSVAGAPDVMKLSAVQRALRVAHF